MEKSNLIFPRAKKVSNKPMLALLLIVGCSFLPGERLVPLPWCLLGLAPFGFGALINILADQAFKTWGTTVKPFETPTFLITNGVFALSRNPMYLGMTCILSGVSLMIGRLIPLLVPLIFAIIIDVRFIRVEEKKLAEQFGQNWLNYRTKVRRWI